MMKQAIRRFFALLLAVLLLLPLLPNHTEAAGVALYDAAFIRRYRRSRTEVADRYYTALHAGPSYVDGQSSTYYSRPASLFSPYDQGKISDDTLAVMAQMHGFLRWLSGGEPLKSDVTSSDSLQRGALVRNFDFTHTVTSDAKKPADMPQALWNSGKNVDNTLLGSGYTPFGVIIGWVNEGYRLGSQSWTTVGHRFNLLQYDVSQLEFGYCGTVAIGNNLKFENDAQVPFTAFPAPGPMPVELVYAQRSCWSLELNRATFKAPDDASVKVTVTNASTGESYVCTKANGKLKCRFWYDYAYDISFVQPPCEGNAYEKDSVYKIEVTGLKDKDNHNAEILYQVEFFSLSDYEQRNPFVDVSEKKYFYDAVLWAYYHDPQVTSGIDPTHFAPNRKCTREQIMTFLWKALGASEPVSAQCPFTDVKSGKYYYKAVLWAVENGVTEGLTPTTFGVGKPCTRAQVVSFLYSAAGKPAVTGVSNPFRDVEQKDYYYNAVLWAVANDITGGTTPTTFSPRDTCTRAQVVTFLYKAITNPNIFMQ